MQLPIDTSACTLRPASPEDALAISDCVAAAYAHWVPRIGRTPWPMLQEYASVLRTEHVVVAEACREIAGVLVLSETAEGFLLDNVAVRPLHRGRGVGKALLLHAEQEAKARGHDSLYLYTNEKMFENIALYEKVGYLEYKRQEGDGFRRVFMRKSLS